MEHSVGRRGLFFALMISFFTLVTGCDSGGSSIKVKPAPGQPTEVKITPTDKGLNATWAAVDHASSYNVYWSLINPVTTADAVETVDTNSATITSLDNSIEVYVAVAAVNSIGQSHLSEQKSATPIPLPVAPTGVKPPVLSVDGRSVDISWQPALGAKTYRVYWQIKDDVTPLSIASRIMTSLQDLVVGRDAAGPLEHYFETTALSFSLPVEPGKTYDISISAVNEAGETFVASDRLIPYEVITPAITPAPDSVTITENNSNELDVQWQAVAGATAYRLYYGTEDNLTKNSVYREVTTGTSFTLQQLKGDQAYQVAITAIIDGVESALSGQASATTIVLPPTPNAPMVSAGDGKITVSWPVKHGTDSYNVYWGDQSGLTHSSTKHNNSTTSFDIENLTNGTTYFVALTAINTLGESSLSAEVSVKPQAPTPKVPVNFKLVRSPAHLQLNWDAVEHADYYRVYSSSTANVTTSSTAVDVHQNNYQFKPTDNAPVFVAITAVNGTAESGLSTELSAALLPIPLAPKNVMTTSADSQVTIRWGSVVDASAYELYWGASANITTADTKVDVTGTHHVLTGLTNGTPYYFAVRAINTSGNSALSSEVQGTPLVPSSIPGVPVLTSHTASEGKIDLQWHGITGADTYTVYYDTTNALTTGSDKVDNIAALKSTLTGLTNGSVYYVAITATNASGESALSAVSDAITVPPTPDIPLNIKAVSSDKTMTVHWDSVDHATAYELYWSTTPNVTVSGTKVDVTDNHHTLSGLTNGTTYHVVVRANNVSGSSGLSNEVNATPKQTLSIPMAPVLPTVSHSGADLKLTWSAVSGATEYRMYYRDAANLTKLNSTAVNVGTGLEKTVSGLTPGNHYYFKVSALNGAGESTLSAEANAIALPKPAATTPVSAVGGDNKVTFSWLPISDVDGYKVYWSDVSGAELSGTEVLVAASETSVVISSGISNGNRYYAVVRGHNASGDGAVSSEMSATAVAPSAKPATPTISRMVAATDTLDVYWSGVSGAITYNVYYGTSAALTTSSASETGITGLHKQLTGLTPGSTYYVAVSATNGVGDSALSSHLNTPVPAAPILPPANFIATSGDGLVTLQWDAVDHASYELFWSDRAGVSTSNTKISETATSHSLNGLTNGIDYHFALRAVNATGSTALSSEQHATPVSRLTKPVAPDKPSITASGADLLISWKAVAGATQYTVYHGPAGGLTTASSKITAGSALSKTLTGLTAGAEHYVAITATNAVEESPLSAETHATVLPIPVAPSNFQATGSDSQVLLSWDTVSGATAYEVYWATATGVTVSSGTKVDTTAAHIVLSTGITNGTRYYAKVRAVNASGDSALSNEVSVTAMAPTPLPSAPQIQTATAGGGTTASNGTLDVRWAGVTGADEYTLYYGTSAGLTTASTNVGSIKNLNHTLTGLTSGATYYVVVSAHNVAGDSVLSSEISRVVPPIPLAPVAKKITPADGRITLEWSAIDHATYEIYYGSSAGVTVGGVGVTKLIPSVANVPHATITGLTNNTPVFVKVLAKNASGSSVLSNELSATPFIFVAKPGAPTVQLDTVSDTTLKVKWNAVSDADGYKVYYGTHVGVTTSSAVVDAGTALNHTFTVSAGTTYYVAVSANNSGGESGLSSEIHAVVPPIPASPINLSATASDGKITLNWDDAPHAASAGGYKVYYGTSPSIGLSDTEVSSDVSSKQLTGLVNTTTYYARVLTHNASGDSALSSEVSATPIAPVAIPSIPSGVSLAATDSAIAVNWPAVTHGTSYKVYWSPAPGITAGGSGVTQVTVNSPSYNLPSLTNGQRYFFRISALDVSGESGLSTELSAVPAIPKPPVPQNLAVVSGPADASFTAKWNAVAGVAQYKLYYVQGGPVVAASASSLTVNNTTKSISGLNSGHVYSVAVASVNASGVESDLSAAIQVTPITKVVVPSQVAGLTATAQKDSIKLAWTALSDATNYKVYWSTSAGVSNTTTNHTVVTTNGITLDNTHLSSGTTYHLRVSAINSAGEGSLSGEIMSSPLAKPATPSITVTGGDKNVGISWAAITGSHVNYNVYWSNSAGVSSASTHVATSGTSYTLPNRTEGETIYVKVSAVSTVGSISYESDLSAESSAVVLGAPGSVLNLAAKPAEKSLIVSWAAATNATSYSVYYGTASGVGSGGVGSTVSVNAPATTATLPNLTNGVAYYVAVKAHNTVGDSVLSNEVRAIPTTPTPAFTDAEWNIFAGDTTLQVQFALRSGATSYNIYWSDAPGVTASSNKASTSSINRYTITKLLNGEKYYVRLSSVNASGESALSAEKSKSPRLAAPLSPTSFKLEPGNQRVTLSWDKTPHAIAYNVYWAAGSGVGAVNAGPLASGQHINQQLIPDANTTSITIDSIASSDTAAAQSLVDGTTYYFAVQAVNSSGDGAKSVEKSTTPFAATAVTSAPTGLTASAGDEAVLLSWQPVTGADSYKVYWGAGAVGTSFVTNITATETAIVDGLTDGTSYNFAVVAVNAAGESAKSTEVTAAPLSLIDAALVAGDSSKLGQTEEHAIIDRLLNELSGALNAEQKDALDTIYGNGPIKYDGGQSSQLIDCSDGASCVPLLVAKDAGGKIFHQGYGNIISGTKVVAYGSMLPNVFDSTKVTDYQPAFKNTIKWLTGKDPATEQIKVAILNYPYFVGGPSGYTLEGWIQAQYFIEGHYGTPNPATGKFPWEVKFCDSSSNQQPSVSRIADDDLAAQCFAGYDLVIIGDISDNTGGVATQRDASKVGSAIKAGIAAGVPMMFFNSTWQATALGKAVIKEFGMSLPNGGGNYYTNAKSDWANQGDMVANLAAKNPLKDTLTHLKLEDYHPDWSQCNAGAAGRIYCIPQPPATNVVDYGAEFEDGAMAALGRLKALDEQRVQLFEEKAYLVEKLLVLLGDVYRKQINYPMEKGITPNIDFLKASFADHVAYENRKVNPLVPDLGDFFDTSTVSSIVTGAVSRTITPNKRGGSTSVGVYAMPSKATVITRADAGTQDIKIYINILRPNGTREFDAIKETWSLSENGEYVRSLDKGYSRAKFLQSPHIILPPNGTMTLTPTYGGMVYVDTTGETADIKLDFSNVAQQAFLADGSDANQVTQYVADLATTQLPWTDIKTGFVEVHSLTSYMRKAIKPAPYNGDLSKFLDITWLYEVKDTYEFAGFTGAGLSLPSKVNDFCTAKSWTCTDADIHASPITLHINTDFHATCGGLCSGNPFDSGVPFDPLGWGESHELGHNLQVDRIRIHGAKSGEVSNNIFPLHKMSSYYKVDQVNISTDYWNRLKYKEAFTIIQNAKTANPADMAKRRVEAFTNIWSKTGAYDQNGVRVTFYRQIAHFGDMLPNLVDDGWDILTLVRLHERLFTDAVESDVKWQANKTSLGFTHANYSTLSAAKAVTTGNEFLPIALSFISGLDMTPFFEMWGIEVPANAKTQIAAYGFPAWTEVFYVPSLVTTGTVGREKGRAHAFRSMRESTTVPIYPAGTVVPIDGATAFPTLPAAVPVVAPTP